MAAAMFMNSNSLPIALMQSLVVTVHGLKWDIDDTKSAMLGRALTYLVLYSTLGMVVSGTSFPYSEFSSFLIPDGNSIYLRNHHTNSSPDGCFLNYQFSY